MCSNIPGKGLRGRRLRCTQPVIAKLHVTLPPAPHRPIADADDLGGLPPRDLLCHCSQNDFLYFHRPLHGGLRVRVHASHGLPLSPLEKRTFHVLNQPDISCANDTTHAFYCHRSWIQVTCCVSVQSLWGSGSSYVEELRQTTIRRPCADEN